MAKRRKKVKCSELSATIYELAMNVGSAPGMNSIDKVSARIQEDFPELNRTMIVDAIVEATRGHTQAMDGLAKQLNSIKQEARRDAALRRAADDLQAHVEAGTFPTGKPRTAPPAAIEKLRERVKELRSRLADADPKKTQRLQKRIETLEGHIRDGTLPEKVQRAVDRNEYRKELRERRKALLSAINRSDPAMLARYQGQIEKLTEQLKNGVIVPVREKAVMGSKAVERAEFERDVLRKKIQGRIAAMKPRTWLQLFNEPFNTSRSIITSGDVSAVLRQGFLAVAGHPIRSAKALAPMFKAVLSPQAEWRSWNEIQSRSNAPLYAKSKLALSEVGSAIGKQEEVFVSQWAQRIPVIGAVVRASERAYTTFLNRVRADAFDAMAATLTRTGEPTLTEARAIAQFVNATTGRFDVQHFETTMNGLNGVFFAPRWAASRFQVLSLQPIITAPTGRLRKQIATEYARSLIGIGLMYSMVKMLAASLGDDEEGNPYIELTFDPRSSDFGKIKIGNTRLDPLGGLSQATVFAGRLATGETKKASTGEVVPIRGDDVPYGGATSYSVITNFMRSKLSPLAGTAVDVVQGKHYDGEPVTPLSTATNLIAPLGLRDVVEAIEEHGVETGAAMGLAVMFGWGLQVHESDEKREERKQLERAEKGSPKKARSGTNAR